MPKIVFLVKSLKNVVLDKTMEDKFLENNKNTTAYSFYTKQFRIFVFRLNEKKSFFYKL